MTLTHIHRRCGIQLFLAGRLASWSGSLIGTHHPHTCSIHAPRHHSHLPPDHSPRRAGPSGIRLLLFAFRLLFVCFRLPCLPRSISADSPRPALSYAPGCVAIALLVREKNASMCLFIYMCVYGTRAISVAIIGGCHRWPSDPTIIRLAHHRPSATHTLICGLVPLGMLE